MGGIATLLKQNSMLLTPLLPEASAFGKVVDLLVDPEGWYKYSLLEEFR